MSNPATPAPAIEAAAFEAMLLDPDVPDEALRPYLMDAAAHAGFAPVVMANPARVKAGFAEAAVALASLNGVARWRRQQRYRRKAATWTGLRAVSEGDSWFQYPLLLKDVIDWLSDDYAVFSLDAAGDLLSDMVQQGELVTAVVQERPHVVLLSGGGNDLLGGAHLSAAVLPFQPGRPAEAYLGAAFDANLQAVLDNYERLLSRLQQVAPNVPVLTHVYDRAIPARGQWLGKPLAGIGITDPALQRAIVRVIVDRFHAGLARLARTFPHVRVIDTRGSVRDSQWHDELHPNDAGFQAVARLFASAIAEATGTAAPGLATEAPTEGVAAADVASADVAGADAAVALLGRHPDDALLREIGRREALAAAGDPVTDEPLAIYPSSVEGTFPELKALGERAVAAAARTLSTAAAAAAGQVDGAGRTDVVRHLAEALAGAGAQPAARTILIAAALARQAGAARASATQRPQAG